VTSEGWFSRLGKSIVMVLVGIVLVPVGTVALFWGEGRTVKREADLTEAEQVVVSIDSKSVSPANDRKLVHFSDTATAEGSLRDDLFGVEVPSAIKLKREVEMYQWKENKKSETRKRAGGRKETITTYTYEKTWSEKLIDSDRFKEGGKNNPKSKLLNGRSLDSMTREAQTVTAGAFTIPRRMLEDLDKMEIIPASEAMQPAPPADDAVESGGVEQPARATPPPAPTIPAGLRIDGSRFYSGNPASPAVGDLRVTIKAIKPQPVSVIAQQDGTTLIPYITRGKRELIELRPGSMTAPQLIDELKLENAIMKWLIRAGGFIGIWLGMALVLWPLKILGDVLPWIGSLAGAGIALVTFLAAAILSLITIALGWIFYRPLLGIFMLALAALGIFALKKLRKPAALPPGGFPVTTPPLPAAAGPMPPLPPLPPSP
jgi:hypothetical protein